MKQSLFQGTIGKMGMNTVLKKDEIQQEFSFLVHVGNDNAKRVNVELLQNDFLEDLVVLEIRSVNSPEARAKMIALIERPAMKTKMKKDVVYKELAFRVKVAGNGALRANLDVLENSLHEDLVEFDLTRHQ